MKSLEKIFYCLRLLIILFSVISCTSTYEKKYRIKALTDSTKYIDLFPSFSPDGKQVVFSRNIKGSGHKNSLFVVELESGNIKCLTGDNLGISTDFPAWGINNLIAFSNINIHTEISGVWILNPATYALKEVPVNLKNNYRMENPSWYPDGESILVVDYGNNAFFGPGILKKVDIETGKVEELTDISIVCAGMAAVSHDGKTIAFAGQENKGQNYDPLNNKILLLNSNGKLHVLDKITGRAPDWSPNDKWIVFESDAGSKKGQYAVFVKKIMCGKSIRITPYYLDSKHPKWSPDGRHIVFSGTLKSGVNGVLIMPVPKYIKDTY